MSSGKAKPELLARARAMRREMTRQERRLWFEFLRNLPVTVHRQKIFGPYIVDFYIAAGKLAVELDGSQHYEAEGQSYDEQRDGYLRSLGLTVLRYSNADIDQRFPSVCEDILRHLS